MRAPRRCRTRWLWWGYVKNCIRVYPERAKEEAAKEEAGGAKTVTGRDCWKSAWNIGPPRPTERLVLMHLRDEQWGREYEGVRQAIEETRRLPDGEVRLKLIDLVFWKRTHTVQGAALACFISEPTAKRWHGAFIRLVAVHMGLVSREDAEFPPIRETKKENG